jgi:CheY-like chemotaxis protein
MVDECGRRERKTTARRSISRFPEETAMDETHEVEILMVEDSASDAKLALRALGKNNLANRIHVVTDGAQALDYLFYRNGYANRVSRQPRVVLLDLKLPKVSGLEVLRQLKGTPETRNVPVVVLTSSREDRDLEQCYQLGVNSYIVKPVDFDQFSKAVSEIGLYWLLLNEAPDSKLKH